MELSTLVLRNASNKRPSLQSYGSIYSRDYNIGLSNLVESLRPSNRLQSVTRIDPHTVSGLHVQVEVFLLGL